MIDQQQSLQIVIFFGQFLENIIGLDPLIQGLSLITHHHVFQARALFSQNAILTDQFCIVGLQELVGVLQFLDLEHSNVASLFFFSLGFQSEGHQLDGLFAESKVALQHAFFSQVSRFYVTQHKLELAH